jgi:drug/metabolite transporter (DMT)-like permease
MLLGAALLGTVAVVVGEVLVVPERPETWLAMAYLIGPGSIAVFVLVLYILARWTASATSYAFLLFPLVAVGLGAVLLQEPVQPSFLLGGAIVLAGVYVGAVYRPASATPTAEGERLPV